MALPFRVKKANKTKRKPGSSTSVGAHPKGGCAFCFALVSQHYRRWCCFLPLCFLARSLEINRPAALSTIGIGDAYEKKRLRCYVHQSDGLDGAGLCAWNPGACGCRTPCSAGSRPASALLLFTTMSVHGPVGLVSREDMHVPAFLFFFLFCLSSPCFRFAVYK